MCLHTSDYAHSLRCEVCVAVCHAYNYMSMHATDDVDLCQHLPMVALPLWCYQPLLFVYLACSHSMTPSTPHDVPLMPHAHAT